MVKLIVIAKNLSKFERNYIKTGYYTEHVGVRYIIIKIRLFYCNSRYYLPKLCR